MVARHFFERYRPRESSSATKYEILKQAIVAAIEDGYWKEGDKLPTEKAFTTLTPFSLGTVQKAIGSLARDGVVRRKRGFGTIVVPIEKRMGEPWIYRVLSADSARFIPLVSRVLSRKEIASDERWARWLCQGGDRGRIMRLDRLVMAEGASFVSRYHVDADRLPCFADIPLGRLHGQNFVKLTQDTYRMSLRSISTTATCVAMPREVTRILGSASTRYCTMIELAADSDRSIPLFYNQLFIPANGPRLYFQEPRTS